MRYQEKLKYFINKVCSISVVSINWKYDYTQMLEYFTGIVEDITEGNLWLRHQQTGSKNCIAMEYIVNISEEQVLYEDNPEHKKIIDEYKKPKCIDIKKLESLVKKSNS